MYRKEVKEHLTNSYGISNYAKELSTGKPVVISVTPTDDGRNTVFIMQECVAEKNEGDSAMDLFFNNQSYVRLIVTSEKSFAAPGTILENYYLLDQEEYQTLDSKNRSKTNPRTNEVVLRNGQEVFSRVTLRTGNSKGIKCTIPQEVEVLYDEVAFAE